MKKIILKSFIILCLSNLSCASINHTHEKDKKILDHHLKEIISQCVRQQAYLYGDLCAESSSGYEDMSGSDAHFEGVICGAQSVGFCIEGSL